MKVQKKRHITVTTLFHRVDSLIRYSTILLRYATYIFIFASFFYVVFVGFIHKKKTKIYLTNFINEYSASKKNQQREIRSAKKKFKFWPTT